MDESTETSILNSVKLGIGGVPEEYTAFDSTLIIYINGVFQRFFQLGIGPATGPFVITGKDETWDEFFEGGTIPNEHMELCKADMILRVRLMFDPPSTSYGIENIKELIREYEWTMNAEADTAEDTI